MVCVPQTKLKNDFQFNFVLRDYTDTAKTCANIQIEVVALHEQPASCRLCAQCDSQIREITLLVKLQMAQVQNNYLITSSTSYKHSWIYCICCNSDFKLFDLVFLPIVLDTWQNNPMTTLVRQRFD